MEINLKDTIIDISKSLNEPEWLLSFREEKLAQATTLPLSIRYGLGITGLVTEDGVSFESAPEYSVDAAKAVELYTWKEAVAQEEIVPYLERLMQSELYPNVATRGDAYASAFFRSGIVIYAQPSMDEHGVLKEEKCMLTTTLTQGTTAADIMIIIVKEGAKLHLENIYKGGGGTLARTLVVLCENDAHVTLVERSSDLDDGEIFLMKKALVSQHGGVLWKELFLGKSSVKSHTETLLIGQDSHTEMYQALIPEVDARQDVSVSVRHIASQTHSHIRAAGIGLDDTKTVYRGLIDMKHGVEAVSGAQEGKFIVLSPKSQVDAIPSLDIASNSVACTHKLSVDHVREGDIFYPKLRGFSDDESKRLFIEGHFADVFAGAENEEIMEDIRSALALRQTL